MGNPTQSWPDTFDPAPNADEIARLATGPLSLARQTPAASPHPFANERATATRFEWPRLQTRPSCWLLILLFVAGLCAWQAWGEFDYSWVLSGPLLFWGLPALILFYALFWRVGEWLLPLGRSYAEARTDGLKLHLFYGRNPVARRFFGNWLTGLSAIWPCRRRLPWRDIEQLAVYQARYIKRWDELYWVRIWSHTRYGYTVLVTPYRQQAEELANLIVQRAKLHEWVEITERGTNLLDPTLGPLNSDDRFRQRLDRRRISLSGANISIVTHLWRTPMITRPILNPTLAAALKLVAAAVLLLLTLNYNYLLSLLLWPPADATGAVGQSPVPPLHEVWSVPVERANYDELLSGGGKLLLISGITATSYDASNGRVVGTYEPPLITAECSTERDAISEDGNYLYYTAYSTEADRLKIQSNNERCGGVNYDVTAFNLTTKQVIWRHSVGADGVFALDSTHNLILASDNIAAVVAIDAKTGKEIWRGEALPQPTATPTPMPVSGYPHAVADSGYYTPGVDHIAVGSDTVYAQKGWDSGTLWAFDVSDGHTRWRASSDHIYPGCWLTQPTFIK